MPTRKLALAIASLGVATAAMCCSHAPGRPASEERTTVATDVIDANETDTLDGWVDASAPEIDAAIDAEPAEDPMTNHRETRADLIALVDLRPLTPAEFSVVRPDIFLALNVGPALTRMNQGNKGISHHAIGKQACLAKLKDLTLQTDEQRERCGLPNMVPVFHRGDPKSASYCIDEFEFPNRPCELPFVWAAPTHAATMCAIAGKRLCSQEEWSFACRGDPSGGADTRFAYGNDLDLDVCNTNKPRGPQNRCRTQTAQGAWETCSTDTEPSGAFPKCRSRFGAFDMHGNVAEVMTRRDADGTLVSQLKGSAFFYAEVARKPEEMQKPTGPETYPDHCNYDPRWHVEPMDKAWHVSYHLGFRCCKSIAPQR